MKIYGKNPVMERLKANPKSVRVIFVQTGHPEHSYIASKARKHGIPVSVVEPRKMLKLGRSLNTQGLIMEVQDFEYVPYEDVLDEAAAGNTVLVFIDGLNDPQNLGAIIRSLGCLGGFTLVLPTHDSVHVTDAVMRVACGGENYVRVAKVNNLNQAIGKAKDKGIWIAGSVVKDGADLKEAKLPFPLALVIGSEEKGIRDVTLQKLDVKLSIYMAHPRMSLNAAHAASIFCYEINKQKPKNAKKQNAPAGERIIYDNLPE
ncbi:MAG: RNA methyltransferase [Candidatus Omnitrophica bacterium]|nr:RNA methyltransferase [Candidatus Omnitrophota bacterium]